MKSRLLLGILLLTTAGAALSAAADLPWINNDYSKALTQAKQRKVPIFVEVWAPW
jgi:hypothetical protein